MAVMIARVSACRSPVRAISIGGDMDDAEARALQPLDARRHDRAVEAQRELRHRRRGHRVAPENGTAMPSFIFWSTSMARWRPSRKAAIERRAAIVPLGMSSLPTLSR